ncbi:MAG: thioredoxin family protein [Saprospiraceae bacterium]|nr:thioredoxin family protein [Saprospiraceae bacterium]
MSGFFMQQRRFVVGGEPEAKILPIAAELGNPVELGKVNWERKLERGIKAAESQDKPIFLLFQEVPGCATCRSYGHNVLSHPLIVEAIEDLFTPVAIYNNKGGEDAKVLAYFREPSWNNPVVRIIDTNKKDIVERISGNYTPLGVVQSMIIALKRSGKEVPPYLQLLEQELFAQQQGTEEATLSMYCFWTGEKNLGALEGVVETQPGFMNGREVVQVAFDPSLISYEQLVGEAQKAQCASHVYADDAEQKKKATAVVGKSKVQSLGKFRLDGEPKYYMSKTVYKYLPMTTIQATKANSLIGQGKRPESVLSPRQIALLAYIRKHLNKKWPDAIGQDLTTAWNKVDQIRS